MYSANTGRYIVPLDEAVTADPNLAGFRLHITKAWRTGYLDILLARSKIVILIKL